VAEDLEPPEDLEPAEDLELAEDLPAEDLADRAND